ncbi:MAG: cysteine desulfurase NifS [Clostridiales bacterium]|jgi:cysteine desulfurase|nr:cysteine desulfurase NifS [Clostridiales bacterium]
MRVYMDNAATTPVKPRVLEAMLPYFSEKFGNPSSLHAFAQQTAAGLEKARGQVADALGASPGEIVFTGGGTESDNAVLRGVAKKYAGKGRHIITTAVEHHAILHTCEALEKEGYEITYLPVDEYGLVLADDVKNAIRPGTILVSVLFANNEVGTLMPIAQIAAACKEKGVLFHTDAVQAIGHIPIDVNAMGIDFLSLSAHKFHGPKGVGALYIKKGVSMSPFIYGGGQERGRRAGTENVPGIVGLGEAIEMATADIESENRKITALRNRLIAGIQERIPDVKLNGHPMLRLPNNVNFSIKYIEGEGMLLLLDIKGIAASSGSACTSGSLDPSHVLLAMGLSHELAHGSLRLTLSGETTAQEVEYVLDTLPPVVQRLRDMSPLNKVRP